MNVYLAEGIGLLLLAVAFSLVRVRNLFASVALLSVYSGLIAVLLALLGAVDVAFTEAVVGSGISTVLLMALLRRIDPNSLPRRNGAAAVFAAAVGAGLAGVLVLGALLLPPFGDAAAPAFQHVSPEYAQRAMADSATPNVVTAVLADYRGFDTLIETAVVATAAIGCLLARGRDA